LIQTIKPAKTFYTASAPVYRYSLLIKSANAIAGGIVRLTGQLHAISMDAAVADQPTAPIMRSAAGPHDPLDRLGLLLYVSAKRLTTQPAALTHLPDTDTLGSQLNGLDQINCNSLHNDSPNTPVTTLWV
jgi:hypothetical protein